MHAGDRTICIQLISAKYGDLTRKSSYYLFEITRHWMSRFNDNIRFRDKSVIRAYEFLLSEKTIFLFSDWVYRPSKRPRRLDASPSSQLWHHYKDGNFITLMPKHSEHTPPCGRPSPMTNSCGRPSEMTTAHRCSCSISSCTGGICGRGDSGYKPIQPKGNCILVWGDSKLQLFSLLFILYSRNNDCYIRLC